MKVVRLVALASEPDAFDWLLGAQSGSKRLPQGDGPIVQAVRAIQSHDYSAVILNKLFT